MKLYYIASGYRRPIDILDNALMKAVCGHSHEVRLFRLNRTPIQSLLPEIRQFAPDFVLTLCGPKSFLPPELIRAIRAMGIPTGVWFTDDPYAIDNALRVAPHYDYVFTIDSGCIPYYERNGSKRVFHLPLGTDLDIFRPYAVHASYRNDVCFIGTGYDNRLAFMKEALRYVNKDVRVQLVGHFWETVDWSGGCVPSIRSKWINFSETPRYFNGASIVLNIHRSEDDSLIDKNKAGAPAHTINNRTFDIAACRAFQLTDYRPDLELFYTPGEEIGCYDSPKQCADLIHHYMNEPGKRQEAAAKAYHRTCAQHTFSHRLNSLLNCIAT
ncbi:CgeB family protein [Paenibacillus apiarius]|uniref:CgeB family protein n=1 Tax=Paenibacillus apiarius TaxID=46240 RepID=UPI003B3AD81B